MSSVIYSMKFRNFIKLSTLAFALVVFYIPLCEKAGAQPPTTPGVFGWGKSDYLPWSDFDVNYNGTQPNPIIKAIAGTYFPWVGRSGNMVTLSGDLSVSGMKSANDYQNVTIKLDQQQCVVTQLNYTYPISHLKWIYNSTANPIAVGPYSTAPSIKTIPLTIYYNGNILGLSTNPSIPARKNYNFWIYRMYGGDGDRTKCQDYVANGVGNYYTPFAPGFLLYAGIAPTAPAHGSPSIPGTDVRQVSTVLSCTAPLNANGNMKGLACGFIQTLNEASVVIPYPMSANLENGNYHIGLAVPTKTHHFLQKKPFPLWDGDNSLSLFYSTSAVDYCPDSNLVNGVIQQTFISKHAMILRDTPSLPLNQNWGDNSNATNPPSRTLGSNIAAGGGDTTFEDALVGYSSDIPGVYIPLMYYIGWRTYFTGYLDSTSLTWVGGIVQMKAPFSLHPVTDPALGPINLLGIEVETTP